MTRYVIFGLGQTGLSCARFLLRKKINFIIYDTRDNPPQLNVFKREMPHIPIYLGSFPSKLVKLSDQLIISPGISLHHPLISQRLNEIPILSDIELFVKETRSPIIAVTGTNGKSTVVTLLREMIQSAGYLVSMGGNIGPPALDLLTQPPPDFYLLELSSYQLQTTYSLKAEAASILNLSIDHLDHHYDMNEYSLAKQVIYKNAKHIVYNRSDLNTTPTIKTSAQLWNFGLDIPQNKSAFGVRLKKGSLYLAQGKSAWMSADHLSISGTHNVENVLAAFALGSAIGLSRSSMVKSAKNFKGLPHRCRLVRVYRGVRWYNDSKATNIGATLAALKGLERSSYNKLILIAGGDGKGADFSIMKPEIQSKVDQIILFGKDANLLFRTWKGSATLFRVKHLHDAVQKAKRLAHEGDIVLFSPACSSLDMFKNFEERGEQFEAGVWAF